MIIFPPVGAWLATHFGMRIVFYASALMLFTSALPALYLEEAKTSPMKVYNSNSSEGSSRQMIGFGFFVVLAMFSLRIGYVLLPNYLEEILSLPLIRIGQLGTTIALGGAVLTLLLGRLKDRWGLPTAFICMFVGFSLILIIPSNVSLFGAFFFLGAWEAAFPLVSALVARMALVEKTGLVFGLQGMLVGVSLMASSWVAGVLYQYSPQSTLIVSLSLIPLFSFWALRLRFHAP
jgi:MFS family permease